MASPTAPQRPTLVSLAREVGVSRQTVANVINAPHLVKPSTRERVLKAILESGYRPSLVGRTQRTNRSMMLGLRLLPLHGGVTRAVMDRFLHFLAKVAHAHGYRLTLFTAADTNEELAQLLELAQKGAIDAAILTDTTDGDARPDVLAAERVNFVAFGRPWGRPESTHSWVDVDGSAGTAAATAQLIAAGHERIGFLGWRDMTGGGEDRRAGWERTLPQSVAAEAGRLFVGMEDSLEDGFIGAQRLAERGATALVCASDVLAMGAASSVRTSGQDVPVIGFDDTPAAAALGLSSVAQPLEEAAVEILATLVAILAGTQQAPTHTLLAPKLVLRSGGPCRPPQDRI